MRVHERRSARLSEAMRAGLRFDLHIHSCGSSDGHGTARDYIRAAKKAGLAGIAITDHNRLKVSLEAQKLGKEYDGFFVVTGIEITTDRGHILAYGLTEPVKRGLSVHETVEKILDLGGVPVAPHPFRFWSGLGSRRTRLGKFVAIEAFNGRSNEDGNRKALKLADELGLGLTGGSDTHDPLGVGKCVTVFEPGCSCEDDVLRALRKGESCAAGSGRGGIETARYVGKSLRLWAKRGFRRL